MPHNTSFIGRSRNRLKPAEAARPTGKEIAMKANRMTLRDWPNSLAIQSRMSGFTLIELLVVIRDHCHSRGPAPTGARQSEAKGSGNFLHEQSPPANGCLENVPPTRTATSCFTPCSTRLAFG